MCVCGGGGTDLTVYVGGEEHAEAAEAALLVRPHPHDPHAVVQHQVVGHRAAELGLQVLNGAAAVVHGDEVLLALVGVLHLVVDEAQVDLQEIQKHPEKSDLYHYIV